MKAMENKIKYLNTEDIWGILSKSSLPISAHIIRLIWNLKITINSFRKQIKQKSRLCVHDGMQQEDIFP